MQQPIISLDVADAFILHVLRIEHYRLQVFAMRRRRRACLVRCAGKLFRRRSVRSRGARSGTGRTVQAKPGK
jgi:hypothetical protein